MGRDRLPSWAALLMHPPWRWQLRLSTGLLAFSALVRAARHSPCLQRQSGQLDQVCIVGRSLAASKAPSLPPLPLPQWVPGVAGQL